MNTGSLRVFTRCTLLALACFAALIRPALAEEEYSFAVAPQYEQRKLFTIWKPIVDAVAKRSGLHLKLVATASVTELEHGVSNGNFDFVYFNPYYILRESTRQGYIPLVRDRKPLRGIVVVAKDSPVKSPRELNGQRLAIPSFNALAASLLVRADLDRLFNVKMEAVDARIHTSVYLQVANGLVAAGGGTEKTLSEQEPAVRNLLRVLYTTREMPSHPFAAHPRVPPEARTAFQKALLELAATPEGREMLEKVPVAQAVPTTLQDYLVMRDWGLEAYWVD
jgi:phosphonate transport system substrate-binding protein